MPKQSVPKRVNYPSISDFPAIGDRVPSPKGDEFEVDNVDPFARTAVPGANNSIVGSGIAPNSDNAQQQQKDLATIIFIIDGGGSAITTGEKGYLRIEFPCIIQRVTALCDTGTIKVDIWKDTYDNFSPTDADSITGVSPPDITANQKYEDDVLVDWTTRIDAGDVLAFNVDSVASATRYTLALKVEKL